MTDIELDVLAATLAAYPGADLLNDSLRELLKPRAGEAVNFLLSASATEGLIVELADGSRATLGVIGPDGQVIADDVTREAFAVAVQAYVEFLRGRGHMRVHRSPPGQITT